MMKNIENEKFDEERALYATDGALVKNCSFEGEKDGESALKECKRITISKCNFHLRYPLWHCQRIDLIYSKMWETCRAPIWYTDTIGIDTVEIDGVKALRECKNVRIYSSRISSIEFGWFCDGVTAENVELESQYAMLKSKNIDFNKVNFKGKYAFQYVENAKFVDCVFDTKDAFWHGKNLTVENSVLKGEYLGWYSENLTLKNCKISGTQPLCYCKNLTLIDCEMTSCDLSFEKSSVEAVVLSHIDSVKNPLSGTIYAPSVGEVIMDDKEAKGKVVLK